MWVCFELCHPGDLGSLCLPFLNRTNCEKTSFGWRKIKFKTMKGIKIQNFFNKMKMSRLFNYKISKTKINWLLKKTNNSLTLNMTFQPSRLIACIASLCNSCTYKVVKTKLILHTSRSNWRRMVDVINVFRWLKNIGLKPTIVLLLNL
jgi:hypothetical protein